MAQRRFNEPAPTPAATTFRCSTSRSTVTRRICSIASVSGDFAHAELDNVKTLPTCSHEHAEEPCIAQGIRVGGEKIGHVHFVDSNRQAAGRGHMDHALTAPL